MHAMTLAEWKTVGRRDLENGAVLDEIYTALGEREKALSELSALREAARALAENARIDHLGTTYYVRAQLVAAIEALLPKVEKEGETDAG